MELPVPISVLLVVPLPWIGAGIPSVGSRLFHSYLTPYVFLFAAAIAIGGVLAFEFNTLPARDVVALAAPLYQVTVGTLAYSIFFRFIGRAPIDVVYNWKGGLFWDRVLAMFIVLGGIAGVALVMGPPTK